MISRGLNSYEKCLEIVKLLKEKNIEEITEDDLARMIAMNIGASKYYKTVRNYLELLINFEMIVKKNNNKFKIDYSVLNDILPYPKG